MVKNNNLSLAIRSRQRRDVYMNWVRGVRGGQLCTKLSKFGMVEIRHVEIICKPHIVRRSPNTTVNQTVSSKFGRWRPFATIEDGRKLPSHGRTVLPLHLPLARCVAMTTDCLYL